MRMSFFCGWIGHLAALSLGFGYREEFAQLPLFSIAEFPTREGSRSAAHAAREACP